MTFPERVSAELLKARRNHAPMHSPHEGFAVLLEEVDELKAEVWNRVKSQERMLAELVQVAAMAQRFAEDCDLV